MLALVGAVGLVLIGVVVLSPEKHAPPPAPPEPSPQVATAPPAPPPASPPPEPVVQQAAQPEPPPAPVPEPAPEPEQAAAPAPEATPDAGVATAEADEDEDHLLAEAVPDAKDVVIDEADSVPEEAPPASPPAKPEPVKVATATPPRKEPPPKPAPKPDPKADTVSVLITSQPTGAVVKLKKRVFGKTPIPLRFRTGIIFELTFVKNGFTPTAKRFLVTKKKDQKVVAYLRPHRRP